MEKFSEPFCAYRPKEKGGGSALQIKLPENKECLFVEATSQQVGTEKKFDWSTKIIMKLEAIDIGKILTVLSKREKNTNLYHKSEKGVTTLSLSEQNPPYKGYYLVVSKKPTDGSEIKASINFDEGEAEILLALFRGVIPFLYKWV